MWDFSPTPTTGRAHTGTRGRPWASPRKLRTHPFHVTVLSQRAPFLAFGAIHGGRLVYVRNEDRVTDFIEAVALQYRDEYPRYRQALRGVNA